MSFAYPDAADQQQPRIIHWIFFNELASCHACLHQMRMRPLEFKIRELTVFVALRNSRCCQQTLGAMLKSAIATDHAALLGRFPSTSTTQPTNFSGNLHERVSVLNVHFAARSRKCSARKLCAHPVELWDSLWRTEEIAAQIAPKLRLCRCAVRSLPHHLAHDFQK